mmetsp:Transcript_34965/g.92624  ORF Transcript_34965/g.92624 Transcript_34965/m.92624 type:complete len:532 (+) Transcript_34965:2-1597(+)
MANLRYYNYYYYYYDSEPTAKKTARLRTQCETVVRALLSHRINLILDELHGGVLDVQRLAVSPEDTAPERGELALVLDVVAEVVDAVVVVLASAVELPHGHIVLCGEGPRNFRNVQDLLEGDGGVADVPDEGEGPLVVIAVGQSRRRQVLVQVDAPRQRVVLHVLPDVRGQEFVEPADLPLLHLLPGAVREDRLRSGGRRVHPGGGHLGVHGERVHRIEGAHGDADDADLAGVDLSAKVAVGIVPHVVHCAQEVVRVGVPPLGDVRDGVVGVAMVAEVVHQDVVAQRPEHDGHDLLVELVGVGREAVLDDDAGPHLAGPQEPLVFCCLGGQDVGALVLGGLRGPRQQPASQGHLLNVLVHLPLAGPVLVGDLPAPLLLLVVVHDLLQPGGGVARLPADAPLREVVLAAWPPGLRRHVVHVHVLSAELLHLRFVQDEKLIDGLRAQVVHQVRVDPIHRAQQQQQDEAADAAAAAEEVAAAVAALRVSCLLRAGQQGLPRVVLGVGGRRHAVPSKSRRLVDGLRTEGARGQRA